MNDTLSRLHELNRRALALASDIRALKDTDGEGGLYDMIEEAEDLADECGVKVRQAIQYVDVVCL